MLESISVLVIPFSLCLAQLVVYDLMSSLVLESVLCFGILLHPVFCSVDGV
jgi:Fe2+ transport system protein B